MNNVLVYYSIQKDAGQKPINDKHIQKVQIRHLLKQGFREQFGIEYQEEDVFRDLNGKPGYIKASNVCFNISHCPGFVAVAFSRSPVGVDAEQERRIRTSTTFRVCSSQELQYIFQKQLPPDNEMRKYLDSAENSRFIKLWTMKESYVKQSGVGLRVSLQQVSFPVRNMGGTFQLEDFVCQQGITTCRYDLAPWHLSVSVEGEVSRNQIVIRECFSESVPE